MTATDASTGSHDTKPAHWIDASIHAVELTATVAACRVLQRLVDGFRSGDDAITRALRTRTFYVVPRVNPDGAEWVLADRPRFRRSSVRPWPFADAHRWPGLHEEDVDGDGRILQMRFPDPDGPWIAHPDDARVLIPVPPPALPRARRGTGFSMKEWWRISTASPFLHPALPRVSISIGTSRPGGVARSPGPATILCRNPRSMPWSERWWRGPTSAASTRSTPAAGCSCDRRPRCLIRSCHPATCGRGITWPRSAPNSPATRRIRSTRTSPGTRRRP